ncbi:MAG: hypothetical protein JW841_03945 [Deltaproteobacteria bacterium]|nr:hypothetical protein [Deltaproteobacteria bacterium]
MKKAKTKNKSTSSQELTLADIPERNRLRQLQSVLNQRRDQIAELDLEIETLREQLLDFESAYQSRLAIENLDLTRIEQLVRYYERWSDLLQEAPNETIEKHYQKLAARRNHELAQSQTRLNQNIKNAKQAKTSSTNINIENDDTKSQALATTLRNSDDRLKIAYRSLARRYHPDLATIESDRVRFSEIMARINSLYHDGDIARLEAMAEQAKGGEVDESELDISTQLETLEQRQEWFDMVLANLQNERQEIESTPTCELMRNTIQAASVGCDLILEIKNEMRERVEKSYAYVANATHELELEVENFNRKNSGDNVLSTRQIDALEQRYDPFADKRLVRLGLEELRDLQVSSEAKALAAKLEEQLNTNRSMLRLLLLTYVAELSPFPLPGLESYDDIALRFKILNKKDQLADSLEKTLVLADQYVEFGIKKASEKVVHLGLRFRFDLIREAVPILLRSIPMRREFKKVLGILGDREKCSSCSKNVFTVPLFRTHGLDDLRSLLCPACGHTLRSYWMPKGKDVQAVLNSAFLDFEIIKEWSFHLGRGGFGIQLLPLQADTITVGELKERIFNDIFKRYELEIALEHVFLAQNDEIIDDQQMLIDLDDNTFIILFDDEAKLRETDAWELLRYRVSNRFRA